MITEMIVSLSALTILIGIGIIATFGMRALNATLPLLRTYVSQKQKAVEAGTPDLDVAVRELRQRVAELEREQTALKKSTAFMESLLEGRE